MTENSTTNNLLAPPSPILSAPKLTVQTSGSATGNPRNKCALKPGHSLMDWIRLGNSGADLSGTKGRIIPVTPEELAIHNTREDAWMAIRGVVYNVTRYMDFHPGGVEELMRGVGKDATKLFNEIHAWVNYQQLLIKCRIGPLKSSVKLNSVIEESLTSTQKIPQFAKPPLAPPQDIVPRLDWIQNRNGISLFFYTKQFCNPGALIRKLPPQDGESHMEIWILIDLHVHKYVFEFNGHIKWPPKEVKISTESGKIEVLLEKPEDSRELWQDLGKHHVTKLLKNSVDEELLLDFKISLHSNYNHDSFTIWLKNDNVIYNLPVGYHVSLEGLMNSIKLNKSYTPIPRKYLHMNSNDGHSDKDKNDVQSLCFLIKKYKNENSFSTYLSSLREGSSVTMSVPKGSLKLSLLANHRSFCFLAAGSGLTPFLSLIDHLLKRNTNRIELLKLFYFNKTSEDIWCREVLSDIAKADERFEFTSVLSNPNDDWSGLHGHVSVELLVPLFEKSKPDKVTFAAVCGPSGFNQNVEEILQELEFPKGNIYVF